MPFLKNLPTIEFGRKSRTIAFILLPVLAVALFSFFQTRKQLIAHVYEERSTLASLSAHVLKEKLDHLSDIGLSLATRPIFCQFVEEKKWDAAIGLMKEVPRDFPYINQLIIADTSGTIMTDALAIDGAKNTNQANRDWYKGIRENWQPYLSAVYQSPGKPSSVYCAFATPVKDTRGNVSAILVLQISPEKLLSWSNDVSVGKSGFVYIVDQKGHIAANPDYASQDSVIDYSSVPAVQKALKGEKNVEILYNPIAKENRLSAYEQVPGYGWAIIVQQRAAIALSVNDSLFPIITFYSVIILMAILFAWLVIRAMVQRENSEAALGQYRDMVENTHVVIRNMEDEIIFWNKGMEKLYGWTREEALGEATNRLFHTKFPKSLVEIEYDLLKNNQWQGELVHIRKDGAILNVSSHWSVHRDKYGNPVAIIETNNDITGLKEAEEQVRKSEENIHSLIDNVKDYAIFQLDKDGRVASWNAGAQHIKGYKEEEIIGQHMEIFYTPEDIEQGIPQRNLQMAKEKGHYEDEGWRIRKDGTRFLADVVFTALHDCNGDFRGIAKVTRDITERKKAEEQVEFLSWQIDKSHDSIFLLDVNHRIKSWNDGAVNLYGFTKEEAIGRYSNELLRTDITIKAIDNVLSEIAEKNYWAGEVKRKKKDDSDVYVHSSSSTIRNKQGEVIGYVAVSFDITEQKKLREEVSHLASLVEQSSEAILSADLDLNILTWNKGAERLHGYAEEEVLGKTSYELGIIHFTDEEMAAMRKRLFEQGGFTFEANLSRKDGSSFYGSVTVDTFKDEQGEVIGIFFIAKDISERRHLEEQLKKYGEELEEKVKERTEEVYKSEKKYRYLFENNPMPMFVMDLESLRFLDVNEIAVIKYGYSRNELLSMTALDIRPDEDKELFKQLDFSFNPRSENYDRGTWRYKKKDGSNVYVEVFTHEIMFSNRPARLVLSNDITEKKEAQEKLASSEKRFRALLENNKDVIALFDESFNIIYRSPSAYHVTGWANDEMINEYGTKNIHPDFEEKAKQDFKELIASPGKSINILFPYLHKRGHYFWAEGTVTNLLHDEDVKAVVFNFRDVTEKKAAEEKLASSEKRFRALLENNNDVISLFDEKFNIIYRSPSARRVTGWSNEETVQRPAISNIHPDYKEKASNELREVLANPGKSLDTSFRYLHKDGHYFWVEGTIVNLLHDENINGIVFNFRDVTLRVEAENKLRGSEKRFRALLENNHDLITLIDQSNKIIYRSPSATRSTGWTDGSLMTHVAWQNVHPDDKEMFGAIMTDLAANPGKTVNISFRNQHKDGHYQWLEGIGTNLLHDENVRAIVFNLRDVTDRVAAERRLSLSEKRYRTLLENSEDIITLIDRDTNNVIYRSPSALRLTGYTIREVNFFSDNDQIHPNDLEKLRQIREESICHPGKAIHLSFRNRHKNGSYLWLEGTITNLIDVENVNGILMNYRDVTSRKEAEEKLELSEKHFRGLIENSVDVITVFDPHTHEVIYNSPSAIHVTGWGPQEFNLFSESGHIHPDDREKINQITKEAIYNPGEALYVLFRAKHKNGYYLWLEACITNKSDEESIRGILMNYRDVTSRIEAEQRLASSEKRFRSMIENNYDMISLFDESFNITYRSPSTERGTGWKTEEMIGAGGTNYVHPDDRAVAGEIIQDIMANPAKSRNTLIRYLHKNGHYLWLEGVITNLLHDEDIKAIVFNFRDVTERIEAERLLVSREKRFRALIENNNDMISLMNESFKIIYRSPSAARITGWSDEELANMDPSKSIMHPDDRLKFPEVLTYVMQNPGKPINISYRGLHKNGHYIWVEGTMANLLHEQDVKAIVFNFRDVTERMESEEKLASSELRFRSLIENSAEGISLLDEHSNVIYRSPSAYKVIGNNPKENSLSLAHPDDLETFKNKFAEALSNPGITVPYQVRYYNASGHYIWAEGIFTNLLHVKGVNAVVANYRDVTDKVEAQEKLASSELLFRSVIEHSAEGVTLTDASMNTFYMSPSASKIVGEHVVFDLRRNAHPGDIERSRRARQDALEHPGEPVPFKGRYLNPSGEYSWLEGTLTNLLHLKGVEAIVSNFRDVTEQKTAEEKLATSELRFRALVEHSAEGISLTDESSHTFYRSPSAIRILGNASLINLRNYAHPRDLKELQRVREESLRKPGVPVAFQGRFLHPHGHHYWMEGSLTNMLHVKGVEAIVANFRDITEKKEAEDRLASSEKRFRSLIENSSDAIVMNDGDYNILYQSPSVEKILGYKAAERVGKQTIDYVHPDNREEYTEFYKKLRQSSGIPMPFQYRYIHKNGNYVWLEGVVSNHLKDPEIRAFVANYRDITDRKRAEEQLQESEKLYRNLFENMLNGFAYCKAIFKRGRLKDYTYVLVNNEIEEMTGLKNITGKNMSEVIPGLLDSDPGLAEVITSVILSGKPEKFETYIKPLERWYAVSLYSPAKGYFVTIADNISERKRAEEELNRNFIEKQILAERMSSILNTLPANIALLDNKGFILDVNEEWKKFANENGYPGSNYCIGDNYIKISSRATGMDKTDGKKVARGIEAVLKNQVNEFVLEYPCDTPKIKRWFRMIVTPLKEKAYTGAVVMHIDISELRRLERERMHSKELEQKKITRAILSAQERERNSIAQELHDNVNQLLAGTNLFLSIAKRNPEKSLEHIETSMESISAAIEENRKLAHGLVTPDFETIKLEDLLRSLTDQMLKLSGIDTHIHMDHFHENRLKDEQKLTIYRIAQEQSSNIVKYAQASLVNISIAMAEGIFTMRIADNGKGMESAKVVNGIGLKNIKSRLTILNGAAKIITAPGKGFALEISMPCT